MKCNKRLNLGHTMLLLIKSNYDFIHLLYTLIEVIRLSETEREKFIRTFVMGRYHQEIVMACKKMHLLYIWFSHPLELWILVDRLTFRKLSQCCSLKSRYEKSEAEWLFPMVTVFLHFISWLHEFILVHTDCFVSTSLLLFQNLHVNI